MRATDNLVQKHTMTSLSESPCLIIVPTVHNIAVMEWLWK